MQAAPVAATSRSTSSAGVEHGALTIGMAQRHELGRLLSFLGKLETVSRCLVALDGTPSSVPQLLGTVDGVPPAAETVLGLLPASATTVQRVAAGWICPVLVRGKSIGAVLVDGAEEDRCKRVAEILAVAVADVSTSSSPAVNAKEALRILVDVGQEIHAVGVDVAAVLESIVDHAHELIGGDVTWLALADHAANESGVTVIRGARTLAMSACRVQLGQGITGLARSARDVVTLDDERHVDARLPQHVHDCLRGEGIVSLVCAPMFHQGELTGNLLVGFRRRAAIPRDAQYLLSNLSNQAATAIAHSRLYASLREQNELLEKHLALSRTLTEASLAGGGQHAIAGELARAIGIDVVVERDGDRAAAWRYPAGGADPRLVEAGTADDTERKNAATIQAGAERLGYVRPADPGCVTEFHRTALGLGATAIALEIAKENTALEAEWRVRGELLEELLQAGDQWSDNLRRRAVHAGINVEEPRAVALIEALPGADLAAVFTTIRAAGTVDGVMIGRRGDYIVAAVPRRHRPDKWLRGVIERSSRKRNPLCAGLSDAHTDLKRALREATGALNLARKSHHSGTVIDAAALGPLRFLLDAPDTTHMVEVVRGALGPLADYDQRRNSDLLHTLRAFLDAGGNHPATAQLCNIHLNTVKYRMARVAELLDCQLGDPSTRFQLSIAFAVADLLEAMEMAPFEK